MMFETITGNELQHFDGGGHRDTQQGKPRYSIIDTSWLWAIQAILNSDTKNKLDKELVERQLDELIELADGEPPALAKNIEKPDLEVEVKSAPFKLVPAYCVARLAYLLHRGAERYGEDNWLKGMPTSRFYDSLFRHLIQWAEGDTTEDHLAAVIFNAMGIMWVEWQVSNGKMNKDFLDMGGMQKWMNG